MEERREKVSVARTDYKGRHRLPLGGLCPKRRQRQRHTARYERLVEPVPLGYGG